MPSFCAAPARRSFHTQTLNCSNELMVVSMSKLKSNSFRLALAVNKSRNVSSDDNFSAAGYAANPLMNYLFLLEINRKTIYIFKQRFSHTSWFDDIITKQASKNTNKAQAINIYQGQKKTSKNPSTIAPIISDNPATMNQNQRYLTSRRCHCCRLTNIKLVWFSILSSTTTIAVAVAAAAALLTKWPCSWKWSIAYEHSSVKLGMCDDDESVFF